MRNERAIALVISLMPLLGACAQSTYAGPRMAKAGYFGLGIVDDAGMLAAGFPTRPGECIGAIGEQVTMHVGSMGECVISIRLEDVIGMRSLYCQAVPAERYVELHITHSTEFPKFYTWTIETRGVEHPKKSRRRGLQLGAFLLGYLDSEPPNVRTAIETLFRSVEHQIWHIKDKHNRIDRVDMDLQVCICAEAC